MNDLVFTILRERSLTPMKEPVLPFDCEHLLWRVFYPAQEKAQVTPIRFHDLRYTFASHLAMMGTGVFQIKELLGHAIKRPFYDRMNRPEGPLKMRKRAA
jgi:integrase